MRDQLTFNPWTQHKRNLGDTSISIETKKLVETWATPFRVLQTPRARNFVAAGNLKFARGRGQRVLVKINYLLFVQLSVHSGSPLVAAHALLPTFHRGLPSSTLKNAPIVSFEAQHIIKFSLNAIIIKIYVLIYIVRSL